jgi:hypothetical protein
MTWTADAPAIKAHGSGRAGSRLHPMLVSDPLATGVVLLVGCLGVLVANVASAAQR